MSRVTTYLNFLGQTEEAFAYYASVFHTEPEGELTRMSDMGSGPDGPPAMGATTIGPGSQAGSPAGSSAESSSSSAGSAAISDPR